MGVVYSSVFRDEGRSIVGYMCLLGVCKSVYAGGTAEGGSRGYRNCKWTRGVRRGWYFQSLGLIVLIAGGGII